MAELLNPHIVKTRKEHECFGCGRKFKIGTKMQKCGVADGGSVFTVYLCETCQEVEKKFKRVMEELERNEQL